MSDRWRELQRVTKDLVGAGNTHGWVPNSAILELLGERDRQVEQVVLAQSALNAQKNYIERQQRIIDMWKDEVNGADPERYQELLIREARIMEGKE